MPTLVVTFGGNALISSGQKGTAIQQLKNVEPVAEQIVELYNRGYKMVMSHGNGPQVGSLLLQQEKGRDYTPQMPLYVCVAQSQGMIGYFLQEALYNHLSKKGFKIPVVTVLTQVVVDPKDPAFRKPSKPVGPFYPTRERMAKEWKVIRTVKGWRRVVASPRPKEIVEAREIKRISRDAIVIACGGGGIPVYRERGLKGIEAVIDKDLTAVKLAEAVQAKEMAVLTDVDHVYTNYKKPHQKALKQVTVKELQHLHKQGHFPPGSMGPKIQSAIRFLQRGGRRVVIAHVNSLEKAMNGEAGTIITK